MGHKQRWETSIYTGEWANNRRRSSKFLPLGQIIMTISRIAKLVAARVEFGRRGMLPDGARSQPDAVNQGDNEDEDDELLDADGERVESKVFLGNRHGASCSLYRFVYQFAHHTLLQSDVFSTSKIWQTTSRSPVFRSSSAASSTTS
jgi:hypothetical protein